MSLGSKIAWDDTALPFLLHRNDIRGRSVRLNRVLEDIFSQHDYPLPIKHLLADAVILTTMIGPAIKLNWKLSLQVRGKGPARLLATDYFAPKVQGDPGLVRAYASYDSARLEQVDNPFNLIGDGYFAVLIDQGQDTEPYSGMTPISGRSLADCAQTYFEQSEQLPTRFALTARRGSDGWRGGGMMLQKMPGQNSGSETATTGDLNLALSEEKQSGGAAGWERVNVGLESLGVQDLLGPETDPTDVLIRHFSDEQPRVFDPHPLKFGCTCSQERVRRALSIYSRKDISRMTTENGLVTADCQFCGAHYELDPATVGFDAEETPGDDA